MDQSNFKKIALKTTAQHAKIYFFVIIFCFTDYLGHFLSDIAMSPCLLRIFHKMTYKKAMDPQKQKFHIVLIFTEPPNFMKMIK